MEESTTQHYATLMGITRGCQRSQALAVAAELGIADLVGAGVRSAADPRSRSTDLHRTRQINDFRGGRSA